MKDCDLSFTDPDKAKPEISDVISALALEAKGKRRYRWS